MPVAHQLPSLFTFGFIFNKSALFQLNHASYTFILLAGFKNGKPFLKQFSFFGR
jgi:hypothetical protein